MCFVPHVPAFQESESSKLLYQIFLKVKEAVSEKNAHPWCPKLLSSLFTKTVAETWCKIIKMNGVITKPKPLSMSKLFCNKLESWMIIVSYILSCNMKHIYVGYLPRFAL